jgi:hypothetical protein
MLVIAGATEPFYWRPETARASNGLQSPGQGCRPAAQRRGTCHRRRLPRSIRPVRYVTSCDVLLRCWS